MEDSKSKYENGNITPEQVLEAAKEGERELSDKVLEGIAGGGVTAPIGPVRNPF